MKTTQERDFREMCEQHDLTYQYSDDFSYWKAGESSYKKIIAARHQLPNNVAVAIWNRVVDTKLIPEAREQFYWKGKD